MATKWKNYNQKTLRNFQAEKLNWRDIATKYVHKV